MIFGMPKVTGCHCPEFARNLNIASRRLLKAAAFYQSHGGIDNGFRREPVDHSRFEPEDVARQVKRADLTPSVRKQLVGPNGATDYLIDVFRRLILSIYL